MGGAQGVSRTTCQVRPAALSRRPGRCETRVSLCTTADAGIALASCEGVFVYGADADDVCPCRHLHAAEPACERAKRCARSPASPGRRAVATSPQARIPRVVTCNAPTPLSALHQFRPAPRSNGANAAPFDDLSGPGVRRVVTSAAPERKKAGPRAIQAPAFHQPGFDPCPTSTKRAPAPPFRPSSGHASSSNSAAVLGKRTVKRLPCPGVDVTSTDPPWRSITAFTNGSPRPTPRLASRYMPST